MKPCLVCNNPIEQFMSFGKMPIANGFLSESQFKDEYFFELAVAFCEKCYMVQLVEQPDRNRMFHENYAFHSSTSKNMAWHFQAFAESVINKYKLEENSYVVEIGSNDGILLKHFAYKGIGHLGVEPSANVAEIASNNGVTTISCFFDDKLKTYKKADVILAANSMCHISNIHSVFRGIKNIMKHEGVFIFEDPYLGDIISKTSYDQIYDEHVFYFSVSSIKNIAEQHDMEIVDIEPQETHGGSMRYTIANKGTHEKSHIVSEQLLLEEISGMNKLSTYEFFKLSVEMSRDALKNALRGKKVVGYGATSKSTTVLNYCDIKLECIYDTTPTKQGKFSPGAHIPVKSFDQFYSNPPDHTLLLAWNHSKEIMEKESEYTGKWITYIPEVLIS